MLAERGLLGARHLTPNPHLSAQASEQISISLGPEYE